MLRRVRQIWQIVREVDLDAIRRRAEAPVRVTVVAETPAEAEQMASRLAGAAWLHDDALRVVALVPESGPQALPGEDAPGVWVDLAVLVGREPGLTSAMAATRDALAAARAFVVTVIVGATPGGAGHPARGERARVGVPSLDDQALDDLAPALLSAVPPDARLALARSFPALRPAVFEALIAETSKANAGYAFSTGLAEVVPALALPAVIGDIVILTKNQIVMSYRIVLAAGKEGRPRDVVLEILGVLGGGLLFRQIARELVGLMPVIGIAPKVAVAYGGTWAVGRAVAFWAASGVRLGRRSLRELLRRGVTEGREVARSLASSSQERAS